MKYNAFISYSHAADGRLAPAVQLALEKFAKPWYKIRNLNVFRDEASLSATPHLWANIQEALENSEYLIYMASPQSAESKWVQKEIEFWIGHRDLDKLLIVLTDGEIVWEDSRQQFKNGPECSLPASLQQAFRSEPFYIDLRAMKTKTDLSLKNSLFKKEILKLAAQLHGKAPKDMAGEEVSAHRKMILVRNGVIAVLAVLLMLYIYQTRQKSMALEAKDLANQAQKIAEEQKMVSDQSRELAEEERRMALQAKEMSEMQRMRADSANQEAIRYRKMAEEQRVIAVQAKEMAQRAEANSQVNSQRAQIHAREATVKWDLLLLLVQKGITADQAAEVIRKAQLQAAREEYVFARIDTLEISGSESDPSRHVIRFLGSNDKVITVVDSLDIPGLR